MSTASEITRKAKSNLAFALKILPPERRQDMVIFYAFCRTMDDLADDPGFTAAERAAALDQWENGIALGFENPTEFQKDVLGLRNRLRIPNHLLTAIIDGCRMDLEPRRFETWDDLSAYIWKVACAVGLVSIRIFGCEHPGSEKYALNLGHALQLTNILRDVREDHDNGGRIYLPLEDLGRFGYTEADLAAGIQNDRFHALMAFEAERAESYFSKAAGDLPHQDRRALVPARIMGETYHGLLEKMRKDGFRVHEKRYRVSSARKLVILSKHLIARITSIE